MKTLAVVLVIVAVAGIVLSVFPNFGALGFGGRNGFGNRGNFSNFTNIQQSNAQQTSTTIGFGFGGILNFVRIGMWIIVLIIAILLMREPKKTKS